MPEDDSSGIRNKGGDASEHPAGDSKSGTVAFIGYARSGEFNLPVLVRSWAEFKERFGEREREYVRALSLELGWSPAKLRERKRASGKTWGAYLTELPDSGATSRGFPIDLKAFQDRHSIATLAPYLEGAYLAHAVQGFFANGGEQACIVRIARKEDIDDLYFSPQSQATGPVLSVGALSIRPRQTNDSNSRLKIEIKHFQSNGFILVCTSAESSETLGSPETPLTLSTVVSAAKSSRLISVELNPRAPQTRPDSRRYTLAGYVASDSIPPSGEWDDLFPVPLAGEFGGNENDRTGVCSLAFWPDVRMICAPDIASFGTDRELALDGLSSENLRKMLADQMAIVDFCEKKGDRVAILDSLPGISPETLFEVAEALSSHAMNGQATLLHPWVRVANPNQPGETICIPPCGHVAGALSRWGAGKGATGDFDRESVGGVLGVDSRFSRVKTDEFNLRGVNCLRDTPGVGVRLWGSRTLRSMDSSPLGSLTSRLFLNALATALKQELDWVRFATKNEESREKVCADIATSLEEERKAGRLVGETSQEAFYIRFDPENAVTGDSKGDSLSIELGVRIPKSTEFAVIHLEL